MVTSWSIRSIKITVSAQSAPPKTPPWEPPNGQYLCHGMCISMEEMFDGLMAVCAVCLHVCVFLKSNIE